MLMVELNKSFFDLRNERERKEEREREVTLKLEK